MTDPDVCFGEEYDGIYDLGLGKLLSIRGFFYINVNTIR